MNKYMQIAIEEAKAGIHGGEGGPFGCVIVKDEQIIGRGHNQVVKNQDPTCHGEMMAIHDACRNLGSFDLSGCELYTTGQPCPMCLGAIFWANIRKVYYGCNVQDTAEIGFRDELFYELSQNDQSDFQQELEREACKELYAEYQRISEKTHY